MIEFELLTFSFVLWLGIYLVFRNKENPATLFSGLGIIFYAVTLATSTLSKINDASEILGRLEWALLLLPPYFWAIAVLRLRKIAKSDPITAIGFAEWLAGGVASGFFILLAFTDQPWIAGGNELISPYLWLIAAWSALPLLASLATFPIVGKERANRRSFNTAIIAAFFFMSGTGLLAFPLGWIPRPWLLIAIALDFELLGFSIAYMDAFNLGEKLLPDFLRSLIVSLIVALIFGGQIAFVMSISTGVTYPMLLLMHLTIAAALLIGNTSDSIQSFAEQMVAKFSGRRMGEVDLRAVSRAGARVDASYSAALIDDETFYRLTRSALTHYGNLPKLLSNPLSRHPMVSSRLKAENMADSPLDRARALKEILADSVSRLKPSSSEAFGDTDEWRFYNALYFPYILGLKPYSRRLRIEDLDPGSKSALEWFRASVPGRTLHNWQTAAARLVMQDLKNRE